jgi:hypothetical protein
LDLFVSLVNNLPSGSWSLSLDAFLAEDSPPTQPCTDIKFLKRLGECLITAFKVACCFAFLSVKGKDDALVKDGKLNKDVEEAMLTIGREVEISNAVLSRFAEARSEPIPFNFGDGILTKAFFEKAKTQLQQYGAHVAKHVLQVTTKLAAGVEALTPHYTHYVSATKFNPSMIKANLLAKASMRKELTDTAVQLHNMLTLTCRLRDLWKQGASNCEDDVEGETGSLEHAHATFAAARTSLTVIAAANILFELSGAQQKAAAIKFLEKDREAEIGKALAEAVKKLC